MEERPVQQRILAAGALLLVILLAVGGSAVAQPFPPEALVVPDRTVEAATSWASGWRLIGQGQTLTLYHNLGRDADDYTVELLFQDVASGGFGINRRAYGGMEVNGQWYGAHWEKLTSNSIEVYRQPDDTAADKVFVWIGVAQAPPAYDSGWLPLNQGQTLTCMHNLGDPAEDLTVSLRFKSAARGVHHFAYGGLAVDSPQVMLGAHWQNLTGSTVEVVRHPDDTDVEQVRVIVAHGGVPAYDSFEALGGWQDVAVDSQLVFAHDLDWPPYMFLVRGECYDTSGLRGIHQLFAGGNHDWMYGGSYQGSNLENLTESTAAIYRQPEDEFCDQVRLRIWVRKFRAFLPLVLRD